MSAAAIGIDLGGTRIKAVALDDGGNLLHQLYKPTNDGHDSTWKQAVAAAVQEMKQYCGGRNVVIGISAPGLPNSTNTAIAYMPGRLQGLEHFNWGAYLGERTWVLNDAVSALVAEARLGAARHQQHVVMITLGTGVGGAIMIDGKPYQGAFNKAGHIGHIVINDDGPQDITGMPGSLEDAIGNFTIEQRSRGRFSSTQQMLDAMRAGDDFAKEVWLTSVRKLAIGIASVTNVLSPETIILGGGITAAGSDLFEPLEQYLAKYEWRAGGNRVAIVQAAFGDLAGATGAACFALEQHDGVRISM